MRLSEAILLGSLTMRAAAGCRNYRDGSGCALGMAEAAVNTEWAEGVFPILLEFHGYMPCCDLHRRNFGDCKLNTHVAQIFNQHVMGDKTWTLEQLVDYVRSIEPPDEPMQGLTREEPCAAEMADKLIERGAL